MKLKTILIGSLSASMLLACATNPLTGKKQIALTDENSDLIPQATLQYTAFIKENKVVTGTADARMVANVGDKIKRAAEVWMKSKGYGKQIENYKWEYKLVQSDQINAWCMPGGKIAVFTGIMKVTQNESGLATVMGHEVAHALLSHSRQRVDMAKGQAVVGAVVGAASSGKSKATQQAIATAYGLGSNLGVMMPFGRAHESEADRLGLILMAIAGYNPSEAVSFWERMQKAGGGAPPEFLSTHPSNATRIKDIQKLIPEAKAEAAKLGK